MADTPGQMDPNVRRPAGVVASSALADELWRQTYQQGSTGEDTAADGSPPSDPGAAPAESQQAQAEQSEGEGSPGTDQGEQGEGEPVPGAAEWEHRFNSMRGRYDQAAEQNRQLLQRLAMLERQVQVTQQPPQSSQSHPQSNGQPLVTREEVDEYGQDFLDVVARRARQDLNPELAMLRSEVQGLRAQLGNVGTHIAMDARSRMEAELDSSLPEWRDINMDQDFLDWLQLPDAYSGVNRHALLRQAFEQNQTPRVQAFFHGFLMEANASRPPASVGGPAPVAPQSVQGGAPQQRVDLTQWAAPGRGRPAAPQQVPDGNKTFISRDDITRFYNDVRAGRYQGRNDVKTQIEQDIMAAQRDGRII